MEEGFVNQLVNFLKGKQPAATLSIGFRWGLLIKVYFGLLILTIVYNAILNGLFPDLPNTLHVANHQNTIVVIAILVIIAPICEETAFRLFLVRFDLIKFRLSLACLVSYGSFFVARHLLEIQFLNNPLHQYFFIISFACLYYFTLLFFRSYLHGFEGFWNRNFYFLFYSQSIIFTLMHFKGYLLEYKFGYLVGILYLIPTFVFALVVSFIRIKFSFFHSLAFHILFNIPYALKYLLLIFLYGAG